MALIIRLRQQGKKNRHSFRLVLTDERYPRDGKYIESLGWYDPHMENEKNFNIKVDRVKHWLESGSMISERACSLVKRASPELIKEFKNKSNQKKTTTKKK